MAEIQLNEHTVALAKEILMSGFKGKFPPFDQCFKKSETITANHVLHEQYQKRTGHQIPKAFIYIVLEDIFGPMSGKDPDGNLGRHLTLNMPEDDTH